MIREERLQHFKDYLSYRLDIIANSPNRWLGSSYNELPTFDYYLEHCVNDKGGKYDFTKRLYRTNKQTIDRVIVEYLPRSNVLTRHFTYSFWMGTPFNYNEIIS
jgi:hypothetical protein